jgi:phosphate transport system permease protein
MFADKSFGVLPLVSATIWTTSLALLIAIPFGLGAAILLSEFAHPKLRAVLKPILEMLAGVPTVVYGLFALQFIQLVVFKEWLQLETGAFSVLAAGLVMGIMIIPTIASIAEDSMSAVPMALRQGSAALGANRMQTSLRVVFPAALSGIIAAIILGVSRAVGETMIVAIAAGRPDHDGLYRQLRFGRLTRGLHRIQHTLRGWTPAVCHHARYQHLQHQARQPI